MGVDLGRLAAARAFPDVVFHEERWLTLPGSFISFRVNPSFGDERRLLAAAVRVWM